MGFPQYRPRRMRRKAVLRRLVRETNLSVDDLIYPLFVTHGRGVKDEIPSMPGNFHFSIDNLIKEAKEAEQLGIPAILLFGIPEKKDEFGSEGYNAQGIIQQALRAIKKERLNLVIITDVCLCQYTSHGHCGIVKTKEPEFELDNDQTLKILAKIALSHAQAGADIVAPSAMMDGQVKVIRETLDKHNFNDIAIMAYAAKYASGFYGPFREAAHCPPQFGDRSSYQMDPANAQEALREVRLNIEEGADIVMVKPALAYLDVIYRVKAEFHYPVAAYNVSGEFSMIKAAAGKGWIEEKQTILEVLTGIKRAGADMILTYFAKEVARWLKP